MKILVFSDSHRSLRFMRLCMAAVKPDAVVHLGDLYEDAQALAQENPHIPFHMVAGYCDRYNAPMDARELLIYSVCGVRLFMTHGHRQHVKQTTHLLLNDARKAGVLAVLFGHTHEALCRQEEDSLWVLNPGSCGNLNASAGLIEVHENAISTCRILRQADIDVFMQEQA